jgi:hypothetical protein
MPVLNQRSLDRLKGVKQVLIDILIEAAKDSPYEFQIPADGGLRTAEMQNALFFKKVSKCDGYIKLSEHQTVTAFDIFLLIDGKASWDKAKLTIVARHIQKVAKEKHNINLIWGGSWKWKDMPHFEIG